MCNLCNLKKYECTRKNDENCSKTERLAAVSVFVQSESPCLSILEIVWNYKTVKNAYFSKIQNSLKLSDFFPNCSRNNRVSTSKNKGVDFLMQCIVFHKFKMPVEGLIFNLERNGFQILVRREIFHKISHFVAKLGFRPNLVCSQPP